MLPCFLPWTPFSGWHAPLSSVLETKACDDSSDKQLGRSPNTSVFTIHLCHFNSFSCWIGSQILFPQVKQSNSVRRQLHSSQLKFLPEQYPGGGPDHDEDRPIHGIFRFKNKQQKQPSLSSKQGGFSFPSKFGLHITASFHTWPVLLTFCRYSQLNLATASHSFCVPPQSSSPAVNMRVTNFHSSVIPPVCISPHGGVWWKCTPGAALLLTLPNFNRWGEKKEAASSHLVRCLLLCLIFLHHQGKRTIWQTCRMTITVLLITINPFRQTSAQPESTASCFSGDESEQWEMMSPYFQYLP